MDNRETISIHLNNITDIIINNINNNIDKKINESVSLLDTKVNILEGLVHSFNDKFLNLKKLFFKSIIIILLILLRIDTLLELFRIRDNIENFNKKALYILIRERTGLKTQNITKVVNRLKKDFGSMFLEYHRTGHFLRPKS